MAKTKYHHLYQRDGIWYFRKEKTRLSLETTVATEAIKMRDRMLENFKFTGQFFNPSEDTDSPTFGESAKEWAEIHKNKVKYSTWRDYRSSMNLHVLPAFKDMPLDSITYLDVEKFVSGLSCGPKRTNNILIPMRSVFKMAYKHGYVQDNVMLKVENLSVELPDIFPLSYDEALQVFDVIDPFYRPYTAVRFFTGMRCGEINALLWSDYKPTMATGPKLYINKSYVYGIDGTTKTKNSKRYIDCLGFVVEALEEQRKLSGRHRHIFLTKGETRMNPDHYRNVIWTKALDKAGLEYRPPIQTRHSFATMMLSAGEDVGWVQNMLGHSSLQMIFTRYFAWVPRKTRNDGAAFMASVGQNVDQEKEGAQTNSSAKVIELFPKATQKRHTPIKKGSGEKP